MKSNPDPAYHYPMDYSLSNSRYGGSGPAAWGNPQGYPGSCTGPVTITFNWKSDTPGDEPPDAVIVAEYCMAQVQCSHSPDSAYSSACDNDLGFPAVASTYGSPYYPSDIITSSGTLYTIKQNPGKKFTMTFSPKATLSGPDDGGGQGTVSVSLVASAPDLQMFLSGGIGPQSAKRYLIGQRATASVTTGGLLGSNFRWSIAGGDPFTSWTANQTNGTFTPLDLSQAHGTSVFCYFKKPDTATFTCTVDLAVPAGAKPAGGFPGTVVTKTATIEPPDNFVFVWSPPGHMGFAYTDPPDPIPYEYGFVGLTIPEFPNLPGAVGLAYHSFVTTPKDYVDVYGDTGGWNFVQTGNTGLLRTYSNVDQHWSTNGLSSTGLLRLDTNYPVAPQPYASFPGNPGKYPADGMSHQFGDGPEIPVGSANITSVTLDDLFYTYVMYLPPGSDSCYVPMRKIKWTCKGTANRIGPTSWQTTPANNYSVAYDGDFYPLHPIWDSNIKPGEWLPKAP